MERPAYKFKIGQQVSYYAGGRTYGKRTGPFTVVALVRQPNGATMYRIKSRMHEHMALEDELKLTASKAKLSPE
jgi:hypothetical protein